MGFFYFYNNRSYWNFIRKVKKNVEYVRATKLYEASEAGSMNLLEEMKKIRNGGVHVNQELPDNVAGANGEEEIVSKFREVYRKLYNSWGSEAQMIAIKKKVSEL